MVEYNEYPPPSYLLKAMENKWALKLIESGEIKLNSLKYLRFIEHPEIGDQYEGIGKYILDDKPVHSRSSNKVYVWSSSLPTIDFDTLLKIDDKYDTIIRISDPSSLAARCFDELHRRHGGFLGHLGVVQYNRGNLVSKDELNNKKWLHNAFQKGKRYKPQEEYRMAFTDLEFKIKEMWLQLEIGVCKDIIKIEYKV